MKNIAAALGLAEDATEEAILAKINEGKTELASARLPPAPDKYMPRADYDTAIARANTAETELATLKKAGREAEIETVIAAVSQGRPELVSESADLLYHLMVVLNIAGIPLKDVLDELQRRTAQSGLQEKANRPS